MTTFGFQPESREGSSLSNINNSLYLFGGICRNYNNDIKCLDTRTLHWDQLHIGKGGPQGRTGHTANVYRDKLLIYGGSGAFNHDMRNRPIFNDLWVFDPITRGWERVNTKVRGPQVTFHGSFILANMLGVFGGLQTNGSFNSELHFLDLTELHWWTPRLFRNKKPKPRHSFSMTLAFPFIPNEDTANIFDFEPNYDDIFTKKTSGIYMFGGMRQSGPSNELWLLQMSRNGAREIPDSVVWTRLHPEGLRPPKRYGHSAVLTGDSIYILGGKNEDPYEIEEISVFSISKFRWMNVKISGLTVTPSWRGCIAPLGSRIIYFGGLSRDKYCGSELFCLETDQQIAKEQLAVFNALQNHTRSSISGKLPRGLLSNIRRNVHNMFVRQCQQKMTSAHKEYIKNKLNPLLHEVLFSVLQDKPEDPVPYMISWLQKHLGVESQVSEKEELHMLRREVARIKEVVPQGSECEASASDGEEIDLPELPTSKTRRQGVSAEVYGSWNKDTEYELTHYSKSSDQRRVILEILHRSPLFEALEVEELEIVVEAMEERPVGYGKTIIRQKQDVAEFFIIYQGTCKAFQKHPETGQFNFARNFLPGECFGELALLYSIESEYTIKADDENVVLFVMERQMFQHLVKGLQIRKQMRWDSFLQRVSVLENLEAKDRQKLLDAFTVEVFEEGEYVLTVGDEGDTFYIIEDGTAIVTKWLSLWDEPVTVRQLKAGDYFGELALLNQERRQANIIANSYLKCVKMNRHQFKRLLGPLDFYMDKEDY